MSTTPDDPNPAGVDDADTPQAVDDADTQARRAHLEEQGLIAWVDRGMLDNLRERAEAPDRLRAGLAERLGVEPAEDVDGLLSALDGVLNDLATAPGLPAEGHEIVAAEELANLRADAELHRTARERTLVDAAIHDGRIPPAARASWMTLLQNDPDGASAKTLAGLRKNTIPLETVGYTGTAADVGEGAPGDEYAALFGDDKTLH
jgi:hypothetical protein